MRTNVQGQFRQILAKDTQLELVDVWYVTVGPKQVQTICKAVKELEDPLDLAHLRRVVKIDNDTFEVMVASCQVPRSEIEQQFSQLHSKKASLYNPTSKEQCQEWNLVSWPILWRGNVSAVLPTIEAARLEQMEQWCSQLITHKPAKRPKTEGCVSRTALLVDPITNLLLGSSSSDDSAQNSSSCSETHDPLGHAVMLAIEAVAARERHKRDSNQPVGYLCQGLELYVSHEPCPMCVMAALHSRIERLVYLKEWEFGGISMYNMHDRAQLNHKFEVWLKQPE